MDVKIAPDWKELLAPEFEKPYFAQLTEFVRQEYASRRIFPRGSNIFRACRKRMSCWTTSSAPSTNARSTA